MNKFRKINTLIILFLLFLMNFFSISAIYSQVIESPISPYQVIIHDTEIGFFVGLGANYNSGEYYAECPECIFDDVSKLGFSLGIKGDYQLSRNLFCGVSLGYEDLSMKGTFRRIESVPLDRVDGTKIYVPIDFRHSADFSISSISLMPNLSFRLDRFLDFRFGFFSDFVISSNFKHNKQLLTKSVILPDGEKVSVEVYQDKDGNVTLEDQTIASLTNPMLGIYPQINFNIELSGSTDLNLGFYYKIPLTNLTSNQSFKINSWRFFLGLSFDLYDDSKEFGQF